MRAAPSTRARRATTRARRATSLIALLSLVALTGSRTAGADDHVPAPSTPAAGPTTERVSIASDGTEGNAESSSGKVSADGRYVAFSSRSDLVADDTNGAEDVFVRDREAATTTRVSIATDGSQGNGFASDPSISADGRYVAFSSTSTNLVAGDTNMRSDVFLHDRQTATTTRVSVATDGTQGDRHSWIPTISDDGRRVVFSSIAENLVPDDTNDKEDIFVHDRDTATTTRVSVATDGTQANFQSAHHTLSADGSVVAFVTRANTLVPDDTNDRRDVFVHDLDTATTTRVSVAPNGTQADSNSGRPALSSDGRYVAFESFADNLVESHTAGWAVFVHDRQTGSTELVSVATDGTGANAWADVGDLSGDARYVAFSSHADNLVPGDTNGTSDVFLHDRDTGTTSLVSVATDGTQGNGLVDRPDLSADGSVVAFLSEATNLVAGDTNGEADVFVRDLGTVAPEAIGQLRVTTTPAVPGQIIVDGIPRDSWGLTWVDMPVGDHDVCFGPVPGYTPPPCEQIAVDENQTTTVEGTYTQRGTLRVLTSPAVPSTIIIDGHPANDWGVWSDLDPGTYEVCWGPVADMTTPPCEDAVITAGDTTVIEGEFTADSGAPGPTGHGHLRAITDPAVASRITIDGVPADTWGLTWLKLDPGTYEICFEPVIHTTAPECDDVIITEGDTTVIEGDFAVHGFLQVTTDPAVGATITVDGHPANAWGVWTSREPGTYEVCYGPLPGLTAPPCEDALVTPGDTTALTATYT